MTARKRKSPDRRKASARRPSLVVQVFSAAGSQIARYPRTVFGTLGLCVVFSFVAGNALWYQPRSHPSPFLATRDPGDMEAIAGYRPNRFPAQGDVTTFHIARAPEQPDQAAAATETPARPIATPVAAVQQVVGQTGATPVAGDSTPAVIPHVVPQPRPLLKAQAEDPVAAAIRAASDLQAPVAPPPRPPADIASVSRAKQVVQDPLKPVPVSASAEVQRVLEIQRGLQNIAYRDVTVDGVVGDTTKAAIRHFQKHYRLPVTGEPSQAVLDKLKSIGAL
ncbi:Putative peptidoglycan binding domain-containing protein [Rhizobium sp. RU35A]|uniref:peptidoglycan-binding domain-containing protein n=1 Tax=Rhizobium sp. RU35A TaxID=1907414 RepID=UPI000953AE1D|nr:peptidoglycan-binding domain-containing protein [Rhizobium sp. RU35A]SIQ54707.1 Putative peptidoglycan binding domain-containing protein [Rhizobium sp. RU35A]